jgi:primase-polymerase (primpol)-like protein
LRIDIPERQAVVSAIHEEIFGERRARREAKPAPGPVIPINLEDTALLGKARKEKDGARFMALYDCSDWRAEGFQSQSEADLWLTGKLAF